MAGGGEREDEALKERLLISEASAAVEKGGGNQKEEEGSLKEKVWDEWKKLWVVAAPAIFSRFSRIGLSVISQAFIGHIGPTELAAYSIVATVLVRFSLGILLGMASALETLCGQAYGAKQNHMLGIYLQRSWLILTGCALCLLPVFVFASPILQALGQEQHLIPVAQIIAFWAIGFNFSTVPSFTCEMFLQSQSKNRIIAYFAAVSLGIHFFLSWLLTVHFELGLTGAMTSTIIAYWLPSIGQLIFVMFGGCRDTWQGFSSLAFKDLWPVVKLSLSSGGMVCLELWYNAILVLLTGNMKNAEVALDALAICININGLAMMISLGFLAAAGVRVSNELGSGNSKGAKFATVNVVITSLAIGVVLFVVFLCLRGQVSYIFTKSEAVAAEVADLSPLLAFSILLNSVQPVLSGVAVGAGWQSYVAYVNLASYYLVGIPTGVVLGYVVGLQVKGVWIGMIFGVFVQTSILTVMTLRTDWEQQVLSTRNRLNRWFVPESEDQSRSSQDS